MNSPTYDSSKSCEEAFYAAFTACDAEAMMAVWAHHAPLLCIHPGSAPLTSRHGIEESWRQIFSAGGGVQFSLTEEKVMESEAVCVRYVHENIHHGPGLRSMAVVCATNVYVFEDGSWRMSLHHASPGPAAPRTEEGMH
jgi:ketosteroid isomerase-like protein